MMHELPSTAQQAICDSLNDEERRHDGTHAGRFRSLHSL
jgi:hypothetical protein